MKSKNSQCEEVFDMSDWWPTPGERVAVLIISFVVGAGIAAWIGILASTQELLGVSIMGGIIGTFVGPYIYVCSKI